MITLRNVEEPKQNDNKKGQKMQRDVITKVTGFKIMDGAGVKTLRLLAMNTMKDFDPFLTFDCFDSTNPAEYQAGFPGQPYRGLEVITYVKNGSMRHRDSLGNDTVVNTGEVEYITAGSGIVQTSAFTPAEHLQSIRFWLNMPDSEKMEDPEYHIVRKEETTDLEIDGAKLTLLTGSFGDTQGYQGKHLPLDLYDVAMSAGSAAAIPAPEDSSVMVFVLNGEIKVNGTPLAEKSIAKLSQGDVINVEASSDADFLIIGSLATNERVVWGNTIIMTNERDVEKAYIELEKGTFLKVKKP